MDELMMNNVRMIREKFVAKDIRFEMYEMKDNSAVNEILKDFNWRKKENLRKVYICQFVSEGHIS